MPEHLDASRFTPHLGASIQLRETAGAEPIEARLDTCEPLPAAPGAPRPDPFRMVVSLDPGRVAGQWSYLVTGAGLVDEPIFFVPIGLEGGDRLHLEAIFN